MKTEILDRAEELGLTIIETTSEGNGYPRNLKKAIVGFESFEQAEEFAKENGGEVIELAKKAGQQLWGRRGRAWEPFDMRKVYDDDPCYELYFCGDEERFTEDIKEQIAEMNDFALIPSFVETKAEIWDEFCTLGEDEFILVKNGEFEEVIEQKKMSYEYDGTYHQIGVIANE